MARTWTLVQTLSVASSSSFLPNSRALTNAARTEMYFVRNASPHKVYKWTGGATLTDIAGSTFPVGVDTYVLRDICVFDGDLFAGYGAPSGTGDSSIWRYNSGTSWTNEYTLEDESPPGQGWLAAGIGGTDSFPWLMDCDASYMAFTGNLSTFSSETFRRMWTRDTAGNYAVNAASAGPTYSAPGYQLVGLSKGSDYGTVWGYDRISSTNYRPIVRGGPSPWTYLTGAAIGAKVPIGYGDGKSFFSHNTSGATWELKYSTDFGTNLTAAGGLTFDENQERAEWKFKNFPAEGIIMLATETDQAYTWDPATDTFVADGTTGQTIADFFILNGELFALCSSATANSIDIYSGGLVSSSGFYYGRAGLQFRSALPFEFLNIGGLAVAHPYAILGSGVAGAQMVAYAQLADDYESFTDFTGALSDDPIMAFDATPYGDAAGASESGADSGPGGGLSDGKC